VATTAASTVLAPPSGGVWLRPLGTLRLVGFFVVQSVLGGVDVARRSIHPSLPISPGLVEVELEHDDARVRAGVAAVVSMLPGTVAATIGQQSILVHALDTGQDVAARVRAAERRVASALGVAG
jgi:multicomponent Na+:H+ antiporter subunit E